MDKLDNRKQMQADLKRAIRDAQWIQREYNDEKWMLMHGILQNLIAAGETSLARLLRTALRISRGNPTIARTSPVEAGRPTPIDGLKTLDCVFLGQNTALPSAPAWEAYDRGSAAILQSACPDDVDAIVELGSGWGLRLADLWLDGAPKSVPYFGCEITATGRACHELLAHTESAFNLVPVAFDYHAPDLSRLAGKFKHVYVFSHTSIEQIPTLKEDVFLQLMALAPKVTVAHLEPVGWQIREARAAVGSAGSSREYAEANDYNRNFWPLLNVLADRGALKICHVIPDLMGINPKNTISLVVWSHE